MSQRWRRKKPIPILDDAVRGRGGVAGGMFSTTDESELSYIEATGTAQDGAATTITLAASASAVDDAYAGMSLQLTAGTGSGQDQQRIVSYVGATKIAACSGAWVTIPDNTSVYRVVNRGA